MFKKLACVVLAATVMMSAMAAMPNRTEAAGVEVQVQDSSFALFNGAARVADATASDGYAAKMGNTTLAWNIQYRQWDFSHLAPGVSYEVYFRVKVTHAVAGPTGEAFRMGVYDMTDGKFVLADRPVTASETTNGTWREYKAGTFQPNNGVNMLGFYVSQANNAGQVSEIYVDSIILKPYEPYTIEDGSFLLDNGASLTTDNTAQDGSVARLTNGAAGGWNVQAPIDGSKIEAGVAYKVSVVVKPERSDYLTSAGDVFGVGVYDATAGAFVIPPKVFNTATDDEVKYKYEFVWGVTLSGSATFNPSHVNRVVFYQVNNASQFPAIRIDKVILTKATVDDNPVPAINAYPYKISPANADGMNDTARITYTLASPQTVTVTVRDSSNATVRTMVGGASQSGTVSLSWDGKNASGSVVPNGRYDVVVQSGSAVMMAKSILVQSGVALTSPPVNLAKDYFPKGVWFEGAAIPKNPTAAAAYADSAFQDIRNAGMNTVIICNFNQENAAVYTAVLDKAALHGLKLIVHSQIFRTVYNHALNNDEQAMYDAIASMIAPFKNHSALYGYLLYDEPPHGNPDLVDTLADMKRMMESQDPNHIVMVDLSGVHSAEEYYDSVKTQSFTSDPYGALEGRPAGDFTNLGYPGVHYENLLDLLTLQVRKDIANEAPFWTILQAFGQTGWYREPTEPEIRAMTYEAIGRGSKGFFYFMYQSEIDWEGMVDANYNHTVKYSWIQQLLSEIEAMKPTIRSMTKIANVASTAGGGGGGGAYASADVTTHEDPSTGDKYLVVVNHDVAAAQNVTITIDRQKLGIDISGITDVYTSGSVSYSTTPGSYTISNLNFAAGAGKILKLTKSPSMVTYTGQDSAFTVFNAATKGNADRSASDSTSAVNVLSATNGWNIQWYWNKANLVPGVTYDLYAVVKIKYADDIYYDANDYPHFFQPAGNAFTAAVFDGTAGSYVTSPITVSASGMENMFWHTIKVGTFVPSQTNAEYVYLQPADNNTANVKAVYVDKFYFVKR